MGRRRRSRDEELHEPEGVRIITMPGGKRRAYYEVPSPYDPEHMLLLDELPDDDEDTGKQIDPFDVTTDEENT